MEQFGQASQLYAALRKFSTDAGRGILTEVVRLYKVKRLMVASGIDPITAAKMLQDDPGWTLGPFIWDAHLFKELYTLVDGLSLGDFLEFYATCKGVKEFPHISAALMEEIVPQQIIGSAHAVSIIGADAFLVWINKITRRFSRTEFVLTNSSNPIGSELLRETLFDVANVHFVNAREAEIAPIEGELVVAFPFICPEKTGIALSYIPQEGLEAWAVEMIARRMREGARLYAIISERPLFGTRCREFRERLISDMRLESIQTLPDGILRPYSRMKLGCLVVSKRPPAGEVELVKYVILPPGKKSAMQNVEIAAKRGCISTSRLQGERSWLVDPLLESPKEILSSFVHPDVPRARLIDVCWTIFRGTGPIKEELWHGIGDVGQSYGLIDIGDIQNGRLVLDSIQEIRVRDPRRLVRHEVYEGDVLVTCRSTSLKAALVPKTDRRLAITSNLICIRPREKALGVILNAFFQSEVGMRMLESLQHGSMAKMIDPKDLKSLPIPMLRPEEVSELASKLEQAEDAYIAAIQAAEEGRRKAYREFYEALGLVI